MSPFGAVTTIPNGRCVIQAARLSHLVGITSGAAINIPVDLS